MYSFSILALTAWMATVSPVQASQLHPIRQPGEETLSPMAALDQTSTQNPAPLRIR